MDNQRRFVIHHSIDIEYSIAEFLSFALGAKKNATSIKNLSFFTKVELLTDINLLTQQDKKKLILFSQIRNKFSRDKEVETFQFYFQLLDKNKESYRYLKELYKSQRKRKNEEEELSFYFFRLYWGLTTLLAMLGMKSAIDQFKRKGNNEIIEVFNKITQEAANDDKQAMEIVKFINSKISEVRNINSSKVSV